ncbi:DUF3822 family protein, partial [Bacteroides sp. OttesenSCG-928-N06]|nr:DUF3822 family protein [Bacteroides sp. OttesenSCG-928-N06]
MFDYSKSEQYILSIRLSADGFYFSVFDPVHEKFVYSCQKKLDTSLTYTGNVKQAFKELEFLSNTYKHVYVLSVDKRFTLVPLELFEEDQTQVVFNFNYSKKENEEVCTNMLVNNSCAVLYGVDKSALALIKNQYPDAVSVSQTAVLVEYFSLKSRAVLYKQMFVGLRKGSLDLYCFDRGYVSLVNSYDCKAATDYSYYTLFVWSQLGMDQKRDKMYVTGNIPEKSNLLEILRTYVENISVLTAEAAFDFSFADNAR